MSDQHVLLAELENAVSHVATDKRGETIARVIDLFVLGSPRYSEDQITVFDDVFIRLAVEIEVTARAMLANRLAPLPNAPPATIHALAFDEEIVVAGPVLTHSPRLDGAALVDNARSKSQQHLLAISRRKSLNESLTDVLVERGDQQVVLSVAENAGAKLSDFGFTTLVVRSADDDRLAKCVGSRPDIPRHHFLRLLAGASEAVRMKLELINPQASHNIERVIDQIASRIQARTVTASRDYVAAQALVESLYASDLLGESQIDAFAEAGKFEETAAALAILCNLSITSVEQAMIQDRPELVLIFAKASGLSWPTAKAILILGAGDRNIATAEFEQCLVIFERMKRATAEQALRFHQERERTAISRPNCAQSA